MSLVLILFFLAGRLCYAANLILPLVSRWEVTRLTYFLQNFLGFCCFKRRIWSLVRCSLGFSLAPRVEDHDAQMINLYWKESASLFQSAGMSSLVWWMFEINELFLCCLSAQCLVLNFVSADYRKWLPSKKLFNFYLFPVSLDQA